MYSVAMTGTDETAFGRTWRSRMARAIPLPRSHDDMAPRPGA